MRDLFTWATRVATRIAPASVAAAAVAFSLGTYTGHAAAVSGHKPARHAFTLALRKRAVTLEPGSSARLTVVIHRRRLRARISFKVVSRLPRGISARFSPRRTRGRRTTLVLRVSRSVAAGRYRLRLRATTRHVRRTVVLRLNVVRAQITQAPAGHVSNFSITGSVAVPLEPGSPQPIDALITNPNDLQLNITSLTVGVQTVTAPQATAALPCTPSDFAVAPYSGPALTIPASSSRSLSALGVPSAQWPEVGLVDRPANQDGCQGASLSLTYSADARLG
jgi:hypothetical protein